MKKIFIFSLFTLCLLSFLFLNMNGAAAAVSLPNFLKGGTGTTAVTTIIQNTITAILGVVGAIALLMFVYGGFMIILSAGSPDKVTKGKNILIWAVIGLFAILGSYMILDFIIKNVK